MRKAVAGLTSLTVTLGLGVSMAPSTGAVPAVRSGPVASPERVQRDELPNPLEAKRRALHEEALTSVLNGTAKVENRNGSKVVKVGTADAAPRARNARTGSVSAASPGRDQYVQLAREQTDRIFVVLAEFGNQRHPDFPDRDTDPDTPGPTVFDGPLHNSIPAPDRTKDNTTIWEANYSPEHYRDLYFGTGKGVESLKTYYQKQSSGRYSVSGEVTNWVKVPYNEARYGRSGDYAGTDPAVCASNVCSNTWNLITDAVNQWVADRKKAGESNAAIAAELRTFDRQDRYDYDGDGNFNEPDGYIDHFQIVHAGGDEADGDPYQGEDAIWSHRWYAYYTQAGTTGPSTNKLGGTQIGNTGLWVGDYTMQPENGGLSVFAHEFGHDLGLPDHYDTAGGPDNAVNWWTLMAQSRLAAKNDVGIGTRPGDLGAWDKLQLGWFDYETVRSTERRRLELGPHEYNSAKAQGFVVTLPKKPVTTQLAAPPEGTKSWWSGTGDSYIASMSRSVTLPAGTSTLSFQTSYNIEDGYDYAYVEANAGNGWVALPGTGTDPGANNGITGHSDGWVTATFDLSAYAGTTISLRVRYATDGGVQGDVPDRAAGIFVDDITIVANGTTVFTDGAENPPNGWTLDGFASVGASVTNLYDNYYIGSNRQYVSYDRYLRTGPYNWVNLPKYGNDIHERFPYQDGLLISYWDTSYSDNNESQHPGQGLVLPIDAHPRPLSTLAGTLWRGRVQTYDAPFSLEKNDSLRLHDSATGQLNYIRGQAGHPLFDDTRRYWYPELPTVGVKVPKTGTTIRVLSQSGTSMTVRIAPKG